MHSPGIQALAFAALGALIAWRIYARFRRMIGRQRLSKYRAPVTLVIFPALVVVVALTSLSHSDRLVWLPLALACGAALGVFGLRQTKFEAIAGEGLFYTPHAPLGVALASLFLARVAYRAYEIYFAVPATPSSPAAFAQSSLTALVFGLLAGYYICYAIGLARWRARVLRARRARVLGN